MITWLSGWGEVLRSAYLYVCPLAYLGNCTFNFVRFSVRVPVAMARSASDDDIAVGYVLYDTIQHNKSIYNARMVSLRAESEARAVTRGRDGEARV